MRHTFVLLIIAVSLVFNLKSQEGFLPNKGQWSNKSLYRTTISEHYLYLYSSKLEYSPMYKNESFTIKVNFLKSNPNSIVKSGSPSKGNYNFYFSKKNYSNLKSYHTIRYEELYKNIDMVFNKEESSTKYSFIVKPKGNPCRINMGYEGTDSIYLSQEGDLYIKTPEGIIKESKPFTYQEIDGEKIEIPSHFVVENNIVSFSFPEGYNKKNSLVIDPSISLSGYSGSEVNNWGYCATYDEDGSLYTGSVSFKSTQGKSFIVDDAANSYQPEINQTTSNILDITLLKIDKDGNVIFSTYLGGSGLDFPSSMIVNNEGNLILVGVTESTDFPSPSNNPGLYTTHNGGTVATINKRPTNSTNNSNEVKGTDIFLAMLDTNGNLLSSTYIGGTENDGINYEDTLNPNYELNLNYGDELRLDVAIDNDDNIYVSGCTRSSDFPVSNASTLKGGQDGVLFSLSKDLSMLLWSKYIGGDGHDAIYSMKVYDTIYIVGGTTSSNLSGLTSGLNPNSTGGIDGFASVLTKDGDEVSFTYIGTADYDQAYFIDIDTESRIVVYGQTSGAYPVTAGTYTNPNSGQFIHKLSADLSTTIFSTVIGTGKSSPDILPTSLLVNTCNKIYFTGWGGNPLNQTPNPYLELSTQGLPILHGFQQTTDGHDFYIMVLSEEADQLLYSTFYGSELGSSSAGREHLDGGISKFEKKGILYHSGTTCRAMDFPVELPPNSKQRESGSLDCNNVFFKIDFYTLEANFRSDNTIYCTGDNILFEDQSIGAIKYFWDMGDGNMSNIAGDIDYTYEEPGDYEITLVIEDSSNCKVRDTFKTNIQIISGNFSASDDIELCKGDTIELIASGEGNGITYAWAPNRWISNTSSNIVKIYPLLSTVYTIDISNAAGCSFTKDITVTVLPETEADMRTQVVSICGNENESVLVNNFSTNYTKLEWDLGDGRSVSGNLDTITYEKQGTYTITLTAINETNGCSNSISEMVTIGHVFDEDGSTINFQDTSICGGDTIQFFSGPNSLSYKWSPTTYLSDPNISSPKCFPQEDITYTVTITDPSNNCSLEYTTTITVKSIKLEGDIRTEELGCSANNTVYFDDISYEGDTISLDLGDGTKLSEIPDSYSYSSSGIMLIKLLVTSGACSIPKQWNFTSSSGIYNTLTPNNDGKNEIFMLPEVGFDLLIFDRWGKIIYQNDDYQNDWKPDDVHQGSYIYRASKGEVNCEGFLQIIK